MIKFDFKKSFGQNFLHDNNIIDKIVLNSGVDKNTLVIEIGPGAGAISKKIIPLSGFSILYEIDTRLKDILNNELSGNDNYKIIFDDVLNQNISEEVDKYNFDKTYVVANLPYYITTPIIRKVIEEIKPDRIEVMVQKEVADRLSAHVGCRDYGMISVYLNAFYTVKKLFDVKRGCFTPSPNVDSAVILLEKHNMYEIKDTDKFEKLIKSAFQFKRKNLRNNLKQYDMKLIDKILSNHNLSLNDRAENIDVSIFIEIANNL